MFFLLQHQCCAGAGHSIIELHKNMSEVVYRLCCPSLEVATSNTAQFRPTVSLYAESEKNINIQIAKHNVCQGNRKLTTYTIACSSLHSLKL